MEIRSTFIFRLKKVLADIPLNDSVLRAFYAAYLVRCDESHLTEAIVGAGTQDSVLAALQVALRDRQRLGAYVPPNVRARFGPPVPPVFRERLVAAVSLVDGIILDFAAMWLSPLLSTDEEFRTLLDECFWYYVARAEDPSPF